MVNSKKWVVILSVILAVAVTLFVNAAAIRAYLQKYQDNYLAAVIDKEELLKNTPSPKIIIIGGSNAAFGFDSRLMGEELGMNVVNMGIQGGMGIRFPINLVKPYVNEGDIILLSPEYHNILGGVQGGKILAQVLILYPQGVRYISSFDEVFEVLKALPNLHTEAVKTFFEDRIRDNCQFCYEYDEIYNRQAFDPETGDLTANTYHPDRELIADLRQYSAASEEFSRNIHFFNSFNDFVESKNAKMYFVLPSIVNNFDGETGQIMADTETVLNMGLNFPMLDSLEESQFAPEFMFDTIYHLNDEGRTIRTNTIIEKLAGIYE